jgi:hypothetical protein
MRKTIINSDTINHLCPRSQEEWLDLEKISSVEVTSEDPNFPIESALLSRGGIGWRASERGKQVIRIIFDNPRPVRRIRLEFSDTESQRTQEFTLRWSRVDGPLVEIVRQQWTFSQHGSTHEIEDYQVELDGVSVLELALQPDLTPNNAYATLAAWRLS